MAFALMSRRSARAIIFSLVSLGFALLLPRAATAQAVWTGATNSSWTTSSNWAGGVTPANAAGSQAVISPCCALTTINQDSGGVWTLESIAFTSSAQFTGGSGFNFVSGGVNVNSIAVQAGATGSFSIPVTFGNGLDIGGDGNLVFSQGLTANAGALQVRKSGTGAVDIAALNPTAGQVIVYNGTLNYSPLTPAPASRSLFVAPLNNAPDLPVVHTGPASWAGFMPGFAGGEIVLTGDVDLTSAASGGGPFIYSGTLSGTGGLRLLGGAAQFLNGVNSFTGGITVENGGGLILFGPFAPGGPVTVNGTGYFATDNGTYNITTLSGTAVASATVGGGLTSGGAEFRGTVTGTGTWNLPAGHIRVLFGTTTATDVTAGRLHVGAQFTANNAVANNDFTGAGTATVATSLTVNSTASSTFSGTIAGTGTLTKNGPAELILSGTNTYQGTTTISGGTLSVTGAIQSPNVTVSAGSTLRGTGSITGQVLVGGTLAPGMVVGILNTGSVGFVASGTLAIEIAGTTAGTGYDQLNVTGSVLLGGPTLALSGAYVPAMGDSFTIINNDGADAVAGGFTGLAEGATIPFNGRFLRLSYAGGSGNDVVLSTASFNVTPSATNGTIAPAGVQSVLGGDQAAFTLTPATGHHLVGVTGSCGGTLSGGGTTFTTNAVTADCTVVATFAINTYTVTPSASSANGTITPNTAQTANHGQQLTFTVTPNATYSASVGGTCGGTLNGTTYTTNAIVAPCTVIASFSQITFTVTPSAGANGTIAPITPQTVVQGATTTFTVTPSPGFAASVVGTCGGTLAGTTYTTNPITANCTVVASFAPVRSFSGPSATGTGTITASFAGGGFVNCGFTRAELIPLTGHPRSPPAGSAPADFPHGLFDFDLGNCVPGSQIVMTIIYPSPLPAGTRYWKYGPFAGLPGPVWYELPATITGNTVVFSIIDGGLGDDDLTANGTIVDQGGPGVPGPVGSATGIPTLSEWAMILLASLLLLAGMRRLNPSRARRH